MTAICKRAGMAIVLLATAGILVASDRDRDWTEWRGPGSRGSWSAGNGPARLDASTLRWKVDLPGKGCSTPIVHEGRIYVTAPIDGHDALLAFDLGGKKMWQVRFGKEVPGRHRNGSGCNASPVTDGKTVFVYFKSGTFAAVSTSGEVRWRTNVVERFGPHVLFWDPGTSPVLTRRHVVLARIHHGDSWLAAFDKTTGKIAWKVDRQFETPREGDHGYTTPVVFERDGKESILVWGAQHVTVYDAKDGKLQWVCGGFNPEDRPLWPAVASPVICGDYVIVAFGRNDRGIPRLHGIRLGGRGDVTATHRQWKRTDLGTFVPTPAVYQGKVYILGDKGRVTCIDPATGKTVWTDSLPKHRRKYYASPLIAAGVLYAVREDGTVFTVDIRNGFRLLDRSELGEPVIASPVPLREGLLLRSFRSLYLFGSSSTAP